MIEAVYRGWTASKVDAEVADFLAEEPGPLPEESVPDPVAEGFAAVDESVAAFLSWTDGTFGADLAEEQSVVEIGSGESGRRGSSAPAGSSEKMSGVNDDSDSDQHASELTQTIDDLADGDYQGHIEDFWEDLALAQEDVIIESGSGGLLSVQGIELPANLVNCQPELEDLYENEDLCPQPDLSPVLDDDICPDSLLPPTDRLTHNLEIENWDWELNRFVWFSDTTETVLPHRKDVEFLVAIWNWLVMNKDLARWAVCLIEGPSNANCVRQRLNGWVTQPYTFAADLPILCPGKAGMCTDMFGHRTTIKLYSQWYEQRDSYLDTTQNASTRLCVLTINSAALLHEMLHSCLALFTQNADDTGSKNDDCGCDHTDMAEAAFAWAIGQRYPCVATAKGCDYFKGCLFMNPCDFSWYHEPPKC